MKKRLISLLVLAIALTAAPSLMAQDCLKCRPIQHTCVPTTSGGFDSCYWANDCIIGDYCGALTESMPPLASEFQVVSVERLDEPQQAKPAETRVASLEKTPDIHHR